MNYTRERLLAFPTSIRIGWKGLPGTITSADYKYYKRSYITLGTDCIFGNSLGHLSFGNFRFAIKAVAKHKKTLYHSYLYDFVYKLTFCWVTLLVDSGN